MQLILTKSYNFKNKNVIIEKNKSQKNNLSIETYNKILNVLKLEKIKNIDEYYCDISNSLNSNNLNWDKIVPSFRKKEYYDYLRHEIQNTEKYFTGYFFNTFPERLKLFTYLNPLDDTDVVPVYKHSSTTGRLSIEKGINYLVMKKDQRKQLRSPYKGHKLYELDFKSCEPNLYARNFNLCMGASDIYEYIGKVVNLDIEDRSRIKRVVLSILYGANERSVSKISKINIKNIRKIKSILNVDEFENSLKREYSEKGYIENLYGRPILSDHNLVNYWIQSSAVDFCCLSFLDFFKSNKNLKLHAVIHDAIIFSSPNNYEETLFKIKELNSGHISIPVEIKPIA